MTIIDKLRAEHEEYKSLCESSGLRHGCLLVDAANRMEKLERALREILTSAEYAGDYDYIADICRDALGDKS